MHGGSSTRKSRLDPEPSSSSSVSLPPLLDSSADPSEHELHVTCFSTNNVNYPAGGGSDLSPSVFPNLLSFQENLQAPFFSPVGPPLVHLLTDAAELVGCGDGPAPEDSRLVGSADMAAYMWTFWKFRFICNFWKRIKNLTNENRPLFCYIIILVELRNAQLNGATCLL